MADELIEDESDEESIELPKGGGNRKLILGLVAFNLIAAGGVAYVVLGGGEEGDEEAVVEEDAGVPEDEGEGKSLYGPMVEMKSLVANLDDPSAGRYVKVQIHLELTDEELRLPVEEAMVPIRSAVIIFFTGIPVAGTVGSANRLKIASDLRAEIEKVVGKNIVKRIFFAEFVTQ